MDILKISNLQPTDVIFFKTAKQLNIDAIEALEKYLENKLGCKVVILIYGLEPIFVEKEFGDIPAIPVIPSNPYLPYTPGSPDYPYYVSVEATPYILDRIITTIN